MAMIYYDILWWNFTDGDFWGWKDVRSKSLLGFVGTYGDGRYWCVAIETWREWVFFHRGKFWGALFSDKPCCYSSCVLHPLIPDCFCIYDVIGHQNKWSQCCSCVIKSVAFASCWSQRQNMACTACLPNNHCSVRFACLIVVSSPFGVSLNIVQLKTCWASFWMTSHHYNVIYGGFLKWGYPQSSSILVGNSTVNHPAENLHIVHISMPCHLGSQVLGHWTCSLQMLEQMPHRNLATWRSSGGFPGCPKRISGWPLRIPSFFFRPERNLGIFGDFCHLK